MASGKLYEKGDSCCAIRVEWTSEWDGGNDHNVTFKVYAERLDWSGNTTFWCYFDGENTPSKNISSSGLMTTETLSITSDDAGKANPDFSIGVGFTDGSGNGHEAWVSVNNLQLDKPPKTLTITNPAGTSVTVKNSSGTALSNGSTIYYGDVLTVTTGTVTGYTATTVTVSGATAGSNGKYTATGNVTVKASASVKSFTLTITAGTGSTITVERTSSPKQGASTGKLSDGATIYYSDVLKITFAVTAVYEITTQTVNGSAFTSGNTHTVTANVTVIAITNTLGLVYIDNGTTLEAYLIYIDNGTSWEQHIPYIDNGSGWDMCN